MSVDLERGPVPNEQTPLLPDADHAAVPEAIPASSMQRTAMHGFAGLGFASSLLSMMTEYSATAIQHPSIAIAGCLGLFLSPYAVFQQAKLTHVQALEQTNSVLEEELRFLQEQQQQIQGQVQQMQAIEQRGKDLQVTLAAIRVVDAQSLQTLERQVEESRNILAQMEQTAQANQVQTFITLLVNADADQNTILNSEKEVEHFLSSLESIGGGQWNREQIRQTIAQHQGAMAPLLELARQVVTTPSSAVVMDPTVSS